MTVLNKASQVGGTHYSATAARCPHCHEEIQHWDLYADAPGLVYSSTKHITRHRQKGGKQDLLKAITEIQKIIEQEYPEEKPPEEVMHFERVPTRTGPEPFIDVAAPGSDYREIMPAMRPAPEEVMRDEWPATRGGAAHVEAAHSDPVWSGMAADHTKQLLPLDTSPEAARARADAFAQARVDDDVPMGWVIRKFTGVGDDEEYWRFRRGRGGDTSWSDKYTTRSETLAMLAKRVDETKENK